MQSFHSYLNEEKVNEILGILQENVETFDASFIKRATKVTSFNLQARDFESLNYKREIQYLFKTYFFPNFDLSTTLRGFDANKFNGLVDDLKSENARALAALHKYPLKGVGPGEVLMYFLIDDAHLGGGSSAGVDLIVGTEQYEIKSVERHSSGYVYGFKLGGTVNISDVTQDIVALAKKYKDDLKLTRPTEIGKGALKKLSELAPREYNEIVGRYREAAYDGYFKLHPIIFMYNSTKRNIGKIIAVQDVQLNDIDIDAVTSGTIKPKVTLPRS